MINDAPINNNKMKEASLWHATRHTHLHRTLYIAKYIQIHIDICLVLKRLKFIIKLRKKTTVNKSKKKETKKMPSKIY